MSKTERDHRLAEQFDKDEFAAMRDDDVIEYRIRYDDGRERVTAITVLAYFARVDPEANVEPQ
jgi:hypothetical protein